MVKRVDSIEQNIRQYNMNIFSNFMKYTVGLFAVLQENAYVSMPKLWFGDERKFELISLIMQASMHQ